MTGKRNSLNRFRARQESKRISRFIKDYLKKSKDRGVVLGISGGIDSAVVACLSKKALGNKVHGLLLFEEDAKRSVDYKHAKQIISLFKLKTKDIPITKIVDSFVSSLEQSNVKPSRITLANIKARTRMILLYAYANQNNLLVIGTGDKSEEEIGYFTKYGDGGVDIQPIAHLYKTEVRALARVLSIPSSIISKPSSPNLWKNHKATDEIPADYPTLDLILSELYDRSRSPREVAKNFHLSTKLVNEIVLRHNLSAHKRKYPPSIERL
ncbi:MAG: NAD+ synthase [Nitrososphaerales archaeon]